MSDAGIADGIVAIVFLALAFVPEVLVVILLWYIYQSVKQRKEEGK